MIAGGSKDVGVFYRLTTDQRSISTGWDGACGGGVPSSCWLIGGGPSLSKLPCADIARSPAPKLAINLGGSGLLRPNFWTAYDPTIRFHRSIYLDAGIAKFLPRSRAMDLVPESTYKVCECPQTYFFDRDAGRGYHDALNAQSPGILDWADSMAQAIDIAYRLGFRRLYLAGCECCVSPGAEWESLAAEVGVNYVDGEELALFAERCRVAGMTDAMMETAGSQRLYHFDETKPFAARLRTDSHYFRIVQALRLSRQALSAAGMQLISVTPGSRLNAFFEYRPVEQVLDRLRLDVGDPVRESTQGLYTQTAQRTRPAEGLMRDVSPPRRGRIAVGELVVEGEGGGMADRG